MRKVLFALALAIVSTSLLSFLISVDHVHRVPSNENLKFSLDGYKIYHSRNKGEVKNRIFPPLGNVNITKSFGEKLKATSSIFGSVHFHNDEICPGCRFAASGGGYPCGFRMQLMIDKKNMSITEAGESLAMGRPNACGRCNPKACLASEKRYLRLDDAAPRVLRAQTHRLRSITSDRRIPTYALSNLSNYFSFKEHVYPAREYLFEFNPSLAKLPDDQIYDIPGKPTPMYLASYRVSTMHNCVPDESVYLKLIGGSWPRPLVWDYLGLALLDSNLSILQDTVIDAINVTHRMQDPRLFVLHDQIYLTSYHRIHPLWVVPPTNLTNTTPVPNMYPSDMRVTCGHLVLAASIVMYK